MTSFWMPLGTAGSSGSAQPLTSPPVALIFLAASRNWFRANGGAELDISCDLALIGVGAVAADAGYTTSNLAEAAMMQEMISRAARVAILADSSKFGRRLFAQVTELSSADYLITDTMPPPALRDALAASEVELIIPASSSKAARPG